MAADSVNNRIGILGGMGPLASAEFLKTIYEFNSKAPEQESPMCILYSDPTFPDRTEAILNRSDELLLKRLIRSIERLRQLGVCKIIIACITIHYYLPKLPMRLGKDVISLIDVAMDDILDRKRRSLLLCTEGTRKAGVFSQHRNWRIEKQYIILPNEEDQRQIHRLIYEIKRNCDVALLAPIVNMFLRKYQVDSFIAGCTELHLLAKYLMKNGSTLQSNYIVDPLMKIAMHMRNYLGG